MKIMKKMLPIAAFLVVSGCTCNRVCAPAHSGNMTYGVPSNEDCIIDRTGYALGFRDRDKQPAWVMYHLTAS